MSASSFRGGSTIPHTVALNQTNFVGSVPVKYTGNFQVRSTVTAVPAAGYTNLTYQWKADGVAISGATSASYTIDKAYAGANITCDVGGTYAAAGSAARANVPLAPTITGMTAGANAVTAAFSRNADNGGAAVTTDRLDVFRVSDNVLLGQAPGTSPITLSGLTNGVPVYGKVVSINSAGPSDPSVASANVTPGVQTLLPANSRLAHIGDSIMAGSGALSSSLALSGLMASGGVMRYPLNNNQALSGQATDWMVTAPVLAAVNALSPKVVWMHIGTNDIVLTNNTPAQIATNIKTACDSYIANGAAFVIVDLILPRNDGPGTNSWQNLSPTRQADLALANNAILALASSQIKINQVPGTFNIAIHCMPDQLHLNDAGAQLVGANFQTILNTLVDESSDIRNLYLDSSNLLLVAGNPQLTGTGGTKTAVTGSVADSWTAAAAVDGTMTVVASKVPNFRGAIGQRFDVSGTPATAGRNISFSKVITISGNIGDTFEAWIDFQLDSGNTGLRNPGVLITVPSETTGDTPGRSGTIVRTQAMDGVLRTCLCGTLTASRTSATINFVATFDAVAISAGITVGRPMIRKSI